DAGPGSAPETSSLAAMAEPRRATDTIQRLRELQQLASDEAVASARSLASAALTTRWLSILAPAAIVLSLLLASAWLAQRTARVLSALRAAADRFADGDLEIGRASCRERVELAVVAGSSRRDTRTV